MIRGPGSFVVPGIMPKPIEEIDPKIAARAWELAGRIEWTSEDWKTFYFAITKAFVEIVGRRANRIRQDNKSLKLAENQELAREELQKRGLMQ